jgi:hypothetical protein
LPKLTGQVTHLSFILNALQQSNVPNNRPHPSDALLPLFHAFKKIPSDIPAAQSHSAYREKHGHEQTAALKQAAERVAMLNHIEKATHACQHIQKFHRCLS